MNKRFYTADDGEIVAFFQDSSGLLPARFLGRDRAEIEKHMDLLWETESARLKRIDPRAYEPDAPDLEQPTGRGTTFVGTRWMQRPDGGKERVPAGLTQEREAQGWIFRGPRG